MRAKAKEMATKMRIARYSISMNSPLIRQRTYL
jgi:hypothetical protein